MLLCGGDGAGAARRAGVSLVEGSKGVRQESHRAKRTMRTGGSIVMSRTAGAAGALVMEADGHTARRVHVSGGSVRREAAAQSEKSVRPLACVIFRSYGVPPARYGRPWASAPGQDRTHVHTVPAGRTERASPGRLPDRPPANPRFLRRFPAGPAGDVHPSPGQRPPRSPKRDGAARAPSYLPRSHRWRAAGDGHVRASSHKCGKVRAGASWRARAGAVIWAAASLTSTLTPPPRRTPLCQRSIAALGAPRVAPAPRTRTAPHARRRRPAAGCCLTQ